MKLLFLTDNFPPEVNAPATRTQEHCKEWVKQGADVTVITCFPNFPQGTVYKGYKNKLYQREEIDGIKVIRVWSFITANEGFIKRTLDYISFAFMALLMGLFVKSDMIVATSPQFFVAIAGHLLAKIKRQKWVMEVRDIWPESIRAVSAMKENKVLDWLEKVELKLYKSAAAIVVVTDSFKVNLTQRGVKSDKIHIVKNGANLELFSPKEKDETLQAKLQLSEDKIIVGYIGTHGLAHSLEFILDVVHQMKEEPFEFVFIGDGAAKQDLLKKAKAQGMQNVKFFDPVPKDQIADHLALIDVALVPLRNTKTFESVIPSKIFETAAMNKPILLGVKGESRKMIETYQAGLYFEPENEKDLINKLILLKSNYQDEAFKKGAKKLASDFDRKKLAANMLEVLMKCYLKKNTNSSKEKFINKMSKTEKVYSSIK